MVQSVEILLDAETTAHIQQEWQTLVAAGLPSQGRHPGGTNRPHLTVGVAGQLTTAQEADVVAAVSGRVPFPLRLQGLLILGSGPFVLARAVAPSVDLLQLQEQVAGRLPRPTGPHDHQSPGSWTAHVTLARRVDAAQLSASLAALLPIDELDGTAQVVRRWDGEQRVDWIIS
jgi:2'-5' RNA ligase